LPAADMNPRDKANAALRI